jgi:hypothetical protein
MDDAVAGHTCSNARGNLLASMLGYFDDLSDAMAKGTADEEHLSEIAAGHSLEVIGR